MSVVEMEPMAAKALPPAKPTRIGELRQYLSVPGNPVDMKEFMEFWKACSVGERDEFCSILSVR